MKSKFYLTSVLHNHKLIILIVLFLCAYKNGYSITFELPGLQYCNDSTFDKKDTGINKQTDVIEIAARIAHIKTSRGDFEKAKGSGPFLSILPGFGYALNSGWAGVISTSVSFYTSKERKKISNILTNITYSQYHQFWVTSNSNVYIDKLRAHLYGDWRYYTFPTNTYGLGINTKASDILAIDFSYIKFYESLYREVFKNVFFGVGYNLDYHWNVNVGARTGATYDQYLQYTNGANQSVSSGITLNFKFDNRRSLVTPQNGSYADIQFRENSTYLGSNQNWQALKIDLRHYIKFPASSQNVIALWSYNSLTLNGSPPYLDLPSIGWDDYANTGRGYVPGRFRGNNLFYFETEYRFGITKNGLLGGVVFGNAETMLLKLSDPITKIAPAYGFGIRIKINKYSNTNVAIDYGFGIDGSRGFFVNLGELW